MTREAPRARPSRPYAYGYQDPGNAFRTVLSYGGATRVPFFSSPTVLYGGRVTGTATQNNARALNDNAAIVSAFRSSTATTPCIYTVTPTSLSFTKAASTASVTVTTTSNCTWTSSSGSTWATVSGSGTVGDGHGGRDRQQRRQPHGDRPRGGQERHGEPGRRASCTYTVSPTSLSFSKAGGTNHGQRHDHLRLRVGVDAFAGYMGDGHRRTAGSGPATVTVLSNTGPPGAPR